jgi:glutamate synthase domain-containing protein 3
VEDDEVRTIAISAKGVGYSELNRQLAELAGHGHRAVTVRDVLGHRYLGTGIRGDLKVEVYGTPGEDLGAFMDGLTLRIHGNAQNAVGNTMNSGLIAIHGSAGDTLGHSMRGGRIWVRGSVGYRVGIHMKASGDGPVIVIGGGTGDFLGEYMAGGVLIVLGMGLGPEERLIGNWVGTGIHGGAIYVRGSVPAYRLGHGAGASPCDEADHSELRLHLYPYCAEFGLDLDAVMAGPFTKLTPVTSRPYRRLYASSVGQL